MRGKHGSWNTISEATKQKVKEHIESFPKEQSHYRNLSFLCENLNVKIMHGLFTTKYPEEKVTYEKYLDIFNHDYKLSFGQPKVDVCGEYESFATKLNNKFLNPSAKRVIEAERAVHIRRSKKFYSAMKNDRNENADSVLSLVFDYMMNIPLPKTPVQEAFYLRQLTVSVFCVHNIRTNKARMYVYHEQEGRRSPNKVCTFLMDAISQEMEARPDRHYTTLHLYSDNCGGQNKNNCMLRFMMALTDNGMFQEVIYYFPIRGHSFNACDRDFGLVKRLMKRVGRIYTKRQIIRLIALSGLPKNNKFEVVSVQLNDILDFQSWWPTYYEYYKIAVSEETKHFRRCEKQSFVIQKCHEFRTSSALKGQMVTKEFIGGLMQSTFKLAQPGSQYPIPMPSKKAYASPLPLQETKIANLRTLYQYVTEQFRYFYKRILPVC